MRRSPPVSRRLGSPGFDGLAGVKVLVVEDELLVAMLIEETLVDHGCQVVGPFTTVGTALAAARDVQADLALLDVNLRGERVYPVAEVLEGRQIPFLLLSGYGHEAVPAEHPLWVSCSKPFLPTELLRAMSALLAREPPEEKQAVLF